MKDYVQKYGLRLLALVVVVTLLFGIMTALGDGKANGAEDTAADVRTPFQ